MNNADTVFNPLKRCMKKKCHEYIYVHDLDFSLKRERERERERESKQRERERKRERAAKLAHALCFDAFVDVFVNEEFKISL